MYIILSEALYGLCKWCTLHFWDILYSTSKIHLFRTLQLFLFRTTTVFGACVFALKGPKLRKNFTWGSYVFFFFLKRTQLFLTSYNMSLPKFDVGSIESSDDQNVKNKQKKLMVDKISIFRWLILKHNLLAVLF